MNALAKIDSSANSMITLTNEELESTIGGNTGITITTATVTVAAITTSPVVAVVAIVAITGLAAYGIYSYFNS